MKCEAIYCGVCNHQCVPLSYGVVNGTVIPAEATCPTVRCDLGMQCLNGHCVSTGQTYINNTTAGSCPDGSAPVQVSK